MRKLELAAAVLRRTGVGRLARRARLWRGVLVLNYHRIGSPVGNPFDDDVFSATADELDEHVRAISRDFEIVGPADLLRRPEARHPRVLLTFDDGYRDSYELALPVLRRHGVVATFFVIPGFLDDPRIPWWDEISWMVRNTDQPSILLPEFGLPPLPVTDRAAAERSRRALLQLYKELAEPGTERLLDLLATRAGSGRCPPELGRDLWMTWAQVRAISAAGMVIGGHSLTHRVLARLPVHEQAREIEGCAARLREELGTPMRYFSYPVGLPGTYDATSRQLLERVGVQLAFAFASGYTRGALVDPLAVPRTAVSHWNSHDLVAATVTIPAVFARW